MILKQKKKLIPMFIRIDSELRDQFKAAAALRGDFMTDVFAALMKEYLKNPSKFNVVSSRK